MLLQKGVDAVPAIPTDTNLNRMAVDAEMNARTLSRIFAVDIVDLSITKGNAIWDLFTDLANKSGVRRWRTIDRERNFGEAVKLSIVDLGRSIRSLKEIAI